MLERPSGGVGRGRVAKASFKEGLDFGAQVQAFADKTKSNINEVHRVVSLKLFSAIIQMTPVDTGEAQGGWYANTGAPMAAAPFATPQAAMNSLARVQGDFSKINYLTNRVAHVPMLEYGTASYGFSPKAPAGMVRINVMRFQRMLSEAVKQVNPP